MTDEWDADLYDERHSFVSELARDLIDDLDPDPGERVLDLGCGPADLTARMADRGVEAIGTDRSAEQLAKAREKHPGIELVRADARHSTFRPRFDGVLSNAVLHWVTEPDAAIDTMHDALRPGGRLVAEFGGAGNVSAIRRGTREAVVAAGYPEPDHPWYFPTLGEYATRLEDGGFEVRSVETFPRPTRLEGGERGLRNWIAMFGDSLLADVPDDRRDAVLDEIEDRLRDELHDEDEGCWYADYQRIRIEARKPGEEGLAAVLSRE